FPVHGCHHIRLAEVQLLVFSLQLVQRTAALITNFESRILQRSHKAVHTPLLSQTPQQSRQTAADTEVQFLVRKRIHNLTENPDSPPLQVCAGESADLVPRQQADHLRDQERI